MGKLTNTTPNGRLAGTPLADNASPSPGLDVKGPTAVLKAMREWFAEYTIKVSRDERLQNNNTGTALSIIQGQLSQ